LNEKPLEHFSVKWPRFTVKNAVSEALHFSVKWLRFAVKNAASEVLHFL
jgi:hypothetical protein